MKSLSSVLLACVSFASTLCFSQETSPVIMWEEEWASAYESDQSITLKLRRQGDMETALTIPWEITATSLGTDLPTLSPTEGTIQIPSGVASAEIELRILDNGIPSNLDNQYHITLLRNEERYHFDEHRDNQHLFNEKGAKMELVIYDNEITAVVDTSFSADIHQDDYIHHVAKAGDGLLLSSDEQKVRHLSSSGKLVATYTIPEPWTGYIQRTLMDKEHRIYLQGHFEQASDSESSDRLEARLLRLDPDGNLDPTFQPEIKVDHLENIILLKDQSLLWVGQDWSSNRRLHMGMLDSNGNADPSFQPDLAGYGDYIVIHEQSDGKILLAGQGLYWKSEISPKTNGFVDNVLRLLPDGTPDPTFLYNPTEIDHVDVRAIEVQADGKILLGGRIEDQEKGVEGMIRLHPDGTWDETFTHNLGLIRGKISDMAQNDQGQVWIGGEFQEINGFNHGNLALINSDGSLNMDFQAGNIYRMMNFWGGGMCGNTSDYETVVQYIIPQKKGGPVIYGDFNRVNDDAVTLPKIHEHTARRSEVRLTQNSYVASEGAGKISIGLTRTGNSEQSQTVHYSVQAKDASAEANVVPMTGVIVFAPLEIGHFISVTLLDDSLTDQETREIILSLYDPSEGLELGRDQASLFLVDDDRESALDSRFQPNLKAYGNDDDWNYSGVRRIQTTPDEELILYGSFHVEDAESKRFNMPPAFRSMEHLTAQGDSMAGAPLKAITDDGHWGHWSMPSGQHLVLEKIDPDHETFKIRRHKRTGELDPTFESPVISGRVQHIEQSVTGEYLLAGAIQSIDGKPCAGIAKLDAQGLWMETFSKNMQFNSNLEDMVNLHFSSSNQIRMLSGYRNRTADSYPSNSLTFHDEAGIETARVDIVPKKHGYLENMTVSNKDGVYVFGRFSGLKLTITDTTQGTTDTHHTITIALARILANGTPDLTFHSPFISDGSVTSVLEDPFGRIYVSGYRMFERDDSQFRLVRLHHDGSLDSSFNTGTGVDGGEIRTMAFTQDGRGLYIGGYFTTYDQIHLPGLARIQIAPMAQIQSLSRLKPDRTILSIKSQPGTQFDINISDDLNSWSALPSVQSDSWDTQWEIPSDSTQSHQFFKVTSSK